LLVYTSYISEQFDCKTSTHSIYLDLQKAFDKVPHEELLLKLKHQFLIHEQLLQWLRAFLTGRRQRVKIGKTHSTWLAVTSGVPQGSVLAPLLFILYINDLRINSDKIKLLKFADDTKVYSTISSYDDVLELQSKLDILGNWFTTWRMPVNISKCGVLEFLNTSFPKQYKLLGESIKVVETERDLGLLINSDLSNKQHIESIISKAMKLYGWLVRNLVTRNYLTKIRMYKAIIRPTLEYASTVWSPSRITQIVQLEKVQRKFTKFALNWTNNCSYEERLQILSLPTLLWRRRYLDLLMTHRIIHGSTDIRQSLFQLQSEHSTLNLRKHRFAMYKIILRSDIYKHHFVNRVVDSWNIYHLIC